MAGDSLRDAMVPSDFARQLERELTRALKLAEDNGKLAHQTACELVEARKERDKWAYECEANMKLLKEVIATATRAIEQRDTLAEALEMVATYTYADGQCDNGYTPQYVAKQALAAVRGGTP
jgi:hypothetical protein